MTRAPACIACALALLAGCATPPVPIDPTRVPDSARPSARPAPSPPRPVVPAGSVAIEIDESRAYQAIEGFGATITEHIDPVNREDLMGALRPRVAEAVFGQVRITMGHVDVGPYENFDPRRYATANDDDDPFTTNWRAFNFVRSEGQKAGVIDLARPHGFDNFTIHSGTNVRWSDPWMAEIRRVDYPRYLQEMAENVVVPLIHWRDRYGIVPARWHHLFNEPTTGNRELATQNLQEVVDIVKAVGARLVREGFGHLKLVIASEETEEASLATARAVLADREARAYVGAISYHTYPYGSVYSDVRRILATSGEGQPDGTRLRLRAEIGNLAYQYGLQVWMTEVSHGGAKSLDSMRGRAIHIHDELTYAYASSYWAMFQAWGTGARGECDEDCLVHFDRRNGTVRISGTGYAIGHYARWLRRGAVRLKVSSDDLRVMASAFRDDASGERVLVLINNNPRPVRVAIVTSPAAFPAGATVKGESSSAEGYWIPLEASAIAEAGRLDLFMASQGVVSVSIKPPGAR